ncbi:O-antigen ligase family protein [Larkinella rosea]|uniref:O-antigen ligase domain-containing protein n=1 Tax=Larkinella rosea TaxID=2025312 RepID=A0A3P1BKM7_9BACT|nr:O-antigen ligase family protein [Larkinella rosea]RRB01234.1 O-antigen ligase domain-containing protein [Larkinella rosea]
MLDLVASSSYRSQNRFWLFSLIGTVCALLAGFAIGKLEVVGAALVVVVPVALVLIAGVLSEPRVGFLVYIQVSFLVNVFARFLPLSLPFGMMVDGVLALTMISLLLNSKRMAWQNLRHPIIYLVGFWFVYTCLEYFNPEAPYRPAWFFHIRPFSMQWIFAACIILVNPIRKSDIQYLLATWLFWSFLAALWSFKQQYLGLTTAEQIWMNTVGAKTHLLFGHLRSFSFYSDAAQFGAEMAGITLVALILVLEEKKLIYKAFYLFLTLVYFWGFAVSGTRSALFVILAGFPFYLLLKRDVTKLALGAAVAIPLFVILKFTEIGSGNYQIQRMRTAVRPLEDPSFILRLQNQEKLSRLMKRLPFGAGLGTSESVGVRYSPWHFASQIAPDSWYVELWIETGIVGVWIYVAMLVAIAGIGVRKVLKLQDPWTLKVMRVFLCEFVGIMVMGYSNPVLGQFPTGTIIFISTVLFTSCERWDTPVKKPEPEPVPA